MNHEGEAGLLVGTAGVGCILWRRAFRLWRAGGWSTRKWERLNRLVGEHECRFHNSQL